MARLEGKKPNTGAIIIGAIIFSLIAAGLFLAFRPVFQPTDARTSNSAAPTSETQRTGAGNSGVSSDSNAADNGADGASENSLTTILTPLPLATPTPATAPQSDGVSDLTSNSATSNSAVPPATPMTAPTFTAPTIAPPAPATTTNSTTGLMSR